MAVNPALYSYIKDDSVSNGVYHFRLQGSLLLTVALMYDGRGSALSYAKSITALQFNGWTDLYMEIGIGPRTVLHPKTVYTA